MNKKFKNFVIIAVIVIVVFFGLTTAIKIIRKTSKYNRTNIQCLTEERVFDYADVLTDEEENKLRDLIKKDENKIGCDIVIVTTNEYISSMMNYADDYYDENKFGYNKPCGDGVLLLDNWYSEEMWVSTTGKVIKRYNTNLKMDRLLDEICDGIKTSPYEGYKTYVECVTRDMQDSKRFDSYVTTRVAFWFALISAGIFLVVNLINKGDEIKPEKNTYAKGLGINMKEKEDSFLSTNTTKRKIQSSSSGSHHSGGTHRSSSGTSHGGGGRHH